MSINRILSLAIIGLGSLLLVFGVGFAVYNQGVTHPGEDPLPDQVAGLSLTQEIQGPRAVNEINGMHRKDFSLTSASIGHYGTHGEVTLWVSGVPFRVMTARILEDMRARIAEGNSPFTPVEERVEGKRSIYVLDGMGQRHFYYQSNRLVIWLAVNPDVAEQALDQTLEFYP